VTAALVAEVVRTQFPELAVSRVTYLNEGCDSAAFDVDETWVFRFPKRADVERQLLIETEILAVLEEQSPIRVPAFRFHGRPAPAFPFHFVGYAKLPGVPGIQVDPGRIPFDAVAPRLARFLTWLHAFPTDRAATLGVPTYELASILEETRAEALDDFALVAGVAPAAPLDGWHAFLKAGPGIVPMSPSAPSLLHNDLAAEHLLLDPTTWAVTGVIDWGDVAIGHPAVDFAGVFHWGGEAFMKAVSTLYGGTMDDEFMRCARYMGACRGVGDVAFGLQNNRPEYIAAGLRALSLCAIGCQSRA
jgi:aminoglycoside phosphotransferase (APT) family kinase protein